MPCFITALTRAAIKRLREKNNKIGKNKNFAAKTQYLNFKAASDNVKMKSDKTLNLNYINFLTTRQIFLKADFSLIQLVKS